MKANSLKLGVVALAAIALTCGAKALTIDQYIFQNLGSPGPNQAGMTGTLSYVPSGNTATLVLTNTSLDSAFTDSAFPAVMLLTGFGIQLPGVTITGGTVTVTAGSTAVNFDGGQNTTTITNQFLYANGPIDGYNLPGVLPVSNLVSSVENGGGTHFVAGSPSINGPGYGAISALETQFGASQPGVRNSITFVLNLSGLAPVESVVEAGNVVLAFGSPENVGTGVPDGGSTVAMMGAALMLLAGVARRGMSFA